MQYSSCERTRAEQRVRNIPWTLKKFYSISLAFIWPLILQILPGGRYMLRIDNDSHIRLRAPVSSGLTSGYAGPEPRYICWDLAVLSRMSQTKSRRISAWNLLEECWLHLWSRSSLHHPQTCNNARQGDNWWIRRRAEAQALNLGGLRWTSWDCAPSGRLQSIYTI